MSETSSQLHRLRQEDLTWREAEGATIVLDGRTWKYLKLNGSGAVLWRALAGGATEDDLLAALRAEFDGIDESAAREDVRGFVAMLRERELLAS